MAYAPGILSGEFIDAAVNNIPVAFSAAAGSKIAGLRAFAHKSYSHVQIINTSSVLIGIVTAANDDAIPGPTVKRARCPGNYSVTFDASQILDCLYFQSEGSAIAAGTIIINLW